MKRIISGEKRNQIYAGVLCALMFFWTIASVLGLIAFFRGKQESSAFNVVGASADVPTDLIDTVPGANYFNISAMSNSNDEWYWYAAARSVSFKGNGNTSFMIGNGRPNSITTSNPSSKYYLDSFLQDGETYIISYDFSATIDGVPVSSYVGGIYFNDTTYYSGDVFVYNRGVVPTWMFTCSLPFSSDVTYKFSNIRINKGTTAYPFMYYFYFDADEIYDLGYQTGVANGADPDGTFQEGYQAGFSAGKTQGYNEGFSQGKVEGMELGNEIGYNNGLEQGYQDGFAVGEEEGYQSGYTEGEQAGFDSAIGEMKAGIFARATLEVGLRTTTSGNLTFYDVPLDESAFIYGGVNFSFINTYIRDTLGISTWYLPYLKIHFAESVTWETLTKLRFFTDVINTSTGKNAFATTSIQLVRDLNYPNLVLSLDLYEDGGLYYLSNTIPYPTWLIKDMNINFNVGRDTQGTFNFSIYDGLSSYTEGYQVGYTDGESNGGKIGYDKGYSVGQNAGYKEGYNVGKMDGIESANEYSFVGLLSAVVDVPVRTFTSLFDFDFLGINLAQFFLSLLSVCFVLVVVKLII